MTNFKDSVPLVQGLMIQENVFLQLVICHVVLASYLEFNSFLPMSFVQMSYILFDANAVAYK